jgi:hypothetical protein
MALTKVRRTIAQPADGTDFTVTITAQPTDVYGVFAEQIKGLNIVGIMVPDDIVGDRTTTTFRVVTTGTLATGDIIEFVVVY